VKVNLRILLPVSVLAFVLFGLPAGLHAQYAFGFEAGVLHPSGAEQAETPTLTGFGLAFRADITEKLKGGAMYSRYTRREGSGTDFVRFMTTPVMGFFEYRFLKSDFTPYASVDFGFYLRRDIADNIATETSLTYGFAPSGGFLYKLSDGFVLSATARYHWQYDDVKFDNLLGVVIGFRTAF
jgi:hypothetical protein